MILGPSYSLQTRRAAVQRSVNWMLRPIEPGNERGGYYMQQCPGLAHFLSLGQQIRGMHVVGDRLFVVSGSALWEVAANGSLLRRGSLFTNRGPVSMASGLTQLVIVDPQGYTLNLSTGVFSVIPDNDFETASTVVYVDGYFVFAREDSQQFFISAIDNAASIDALDFASSESNPDNLVTALVTQRELWMMGTNSIEVWTNVGAADFPFARVSGAILEVGCLGAASQIDNTVVWLGRDRNGTGMVYRADGYRPVRISTYAVEEALRQSSDLTAATCWAYQQDGQTFWCLNAPGLESTWVYDVSSGQWHERAEVVGGRYQPLRARVHAFCHGKHYVGDDDGHIYTIEPSLNTIDGVAMVRERTSPHQAVPSRNRLYFHELRLDVEVGQTSQSLAPVIELQWSDDGGETWGNWLPRSLGQIGQYKTRVHWPRLGSARDRVWRIRTTSDARASIIGASVRSDEALA